MTLEELYGKNFFQGNLFRDAYGKTDVRGTGGSVRHGGYFSNDNPYAVQLSQASNNQDIDALYELAVKWEADRANTLEQREYNEEVLRDQRDYDSPLARLQRERAAGINGDLPTGSGSTGSSGSSAQMNVASMPQQQGQTKFSNVYDNASMVMQGFQTAGSVVSSISTLGTGIVGCIDTLSTMPSRIALTEAQSNLANSSANATQLLAPSQKRQVDLSNLQSALGIYDTFAGIFDDKSSDEDISLMAGNIGISEAERPNFIKGFRNYQTNPKLQKWYADNRVSALYSQEREKQYSPLVIGNQVSLGLQVQEAQLQFQKDDSQLRANIASYLNTDSYAESSAGVLIGNTSLSSEQIDFARKRLERDVTAYTKNLDYLKTACSQCSATIAKIYSDARSEGRLITPAEQAIIDSEYIKYNQIMALGSNQLQSLYSIARSSANARYMSEVNMSAGQVEMTPGIEKHNIFAQYTFGQVVSGDVGWDKVVSSVIGLIPYVGGVAQNAVGSSAPASPYNGYSYNSTQ